MLYLMITLATDWDMYMCRFVVIHNSEYNMQYMLVCIIQTRALLIATTNLFKAHCIIIMILYK